MKKKLLFFGLNTVYSISGWLICIVQIGASKISNYNQNLMTALAVLQLSVGLFINIFLYSLIKKKSFEKAKNYKKLMIIDCAIIILPYFLMILLAIIYLF